MMLVGKVGGLILKVMASVGLDLYVFSVSISVLCLIPTECLCDRHVHPVVR